ERGARRPIGTVTFLFTDVEQSTAAWEDHPREMARAMRRHHQLLDAAIEEHGGIRAIERAAGHSALARGAGGWGTPSPGWGRGPCSPPPASPRRRSRTTEASEPSSKGPVTRSW